MIHALLAAAGIGAFALSHPGLFSGSGIPLIAWIQYVPVLSLVARSRWRHVWLWGGAYGTGSFALYAFWMFRSHFIGFIVVICSYFFFYALLFLALKSTTVFFPRQWTLVAWLLIVSAEYIRTIGFLGFHYGVTGYTQWQFPRLISVSRITGVWGVSALVILCSVLVFRIGGSLYRAVADFSEQRFRQPFSDSAHGRCPETRWWHRAARSGKTVAREKGALLALCALFVGAVWYAGRIPYQSDEFPAVRVAAIQNNADPWLGGLSAYPADVATLMEVTDRALAADTAIRLVAWPETAVVPSVLLHYANRHDRGRFELVRLLLEYIDQNDAVLVIGNDHAELDRDGRRTDYNSALVFTPRVNTVPPHPDRYTKQHLVPFTEYFPFPERFPWLYRKLRLGNTHLWTPGHECTVFHAAGLHFATPICFEDTFGDDMRRMVLNGARAFINLSNDAWSKSRACQNQHVAMAVFRSVENGVPTVRSTASGETCIIAPDGRIIERLPPFVAGSVIGDIPALPADMRLTFYTRRGDWFPHLCMLIIGVLGCGRGIAALVRKKRIR